MKGSGQCDNRTNLDLNNLTGDISEQNKEESLENNIKNKSVPDNAGENLKNYLAKRIVSSKGYGHASSIPLGLSVEKQNELRDLAKYYRLDSVHSLTYEKYNTHSLKELRSEYFNEFKNYIIDKGTKVKEIRDKADLLAQSIREEFNVKSDKEADDIALEISRLLNATSYRALPTNPYSSSDNYFYNKGIVEKAKQALAKEQGEKLIFKLDYTLFDKYEKEVESKTIQFNNKEELNNKITEIINKIKDYNLLDPFNQRCDELAEEIKNNLYGEYKFSLWYYGGYDEEEDDYYDDEIIILNCQININYDDNKIVDPDPYKQPRFY